MAFKSVEIGQEPFSLYWKPSLVGESIEGNVYDFEEDEYGHERMLLYRGEKDGDMLITTLPSHGNLRRYHENLNVGEYIRITVTNIKEPSREGYSPMNIYKVERDDTRFVEFDE